MSSETMKDRIAELESKIEALADQCHDLKWQIVTMAISKISDPRYPYWNWILSRALPADAERKLSAVLSALDARAAGVQLSDGLNKDIEGVSREVLYGSDSPATEDVFAAIKSVTGMEHDSDAIELLRAVYDQGLHQTLCEHVFSTLDRA